MNQNKIETYKDLLEEKQRLQQLLVIQKEQISTNWGTMKQEFEPVRNVVTFFSKLTTRDKSNPLLNMGIDLAGDLVLRKLLLAKFGWAARLVIPFLLKNYSSNVFAEKGKSLFHRVKHILKRGKNGTPQEFYKDTQ